MPMSKTVPDAPPDLWGQKIYAQFLGEIDPFEDHEHFRPLDRAYTGDNTFWTVPSPEPRLSDAFWKRVAAHLDDEKIQEAGRCLAEAVSRWEPQGDHLVFAAILRAGVPVADWLCRFFPGAKAAALSLFVGLGIDGAALDALRRRHPKRKIVFVDGWTGRGGVARAISGLGMGPLAVLIDPWGWADFSGTREDLFCPTACFTGVATLGFSRTFFVDRTRLFGAYRFPGRYCRGALVKAWQDLWPGMGSTGGVRRPRPRRFFRETSLRIHANEVCRALINAAPERLLFLDPADVAKRLYPLLPDLAERRKVPVQYGVGRIADLGTRVACTLKSTGA
ncbi:cysteine protease StiP domain-containing protein [Desulfococcus sp.]|uniref:cysteine protease StiP domain-containing protein n=1 Tax=Desulfococcus sp. TaxID=2025834 RepID=UPI0035943E97